MDRFKPALLYLYIWNIYILPPIFDIYTTRAKRNFLSTIDNQQDNIIPDLEILNPKRDDLSDSYMYQNRFRPGDASTKIYKLKITLIPEISSNIPSTESQDAKTKQYCRLCINQYTITTKTSILHNLIQHITLDYDQPNINTNYNCLEPIQIPLFRATINSNKRWTNKPKKRS